jgi:hypothetical protein
MLRRILDWHPPTRGCVLGSGRYLPRTRSVSSLSTDCAKRWGALPLLLLMNMFSAIFTGELTGAAAAGPHTARAGGSGGSGCRRSSGAARAGRGAAHQHFI